MNTIKNIHKLKGIITDVNILKLDQSAALHLRHSNITFKIIEVNSTELHVRAEQGKSLPENYADKPTLVTRSRELFSKFVPDLTIYTHPVPYEPAVVDVVTPAWINDQMLKRGIKVKDISKDTGLDKSNISAWINNLREMSQIVKAMFYYYFEKQ